MLIEFKIQLDSDGGVSILPAANQAPGSQQQKLVPPVYNQPQHGAARIGGQPVDGPGTGTPGPMSPQGSGVVFVLGPIVICGSGAAHTGGGSQPTNGPGTGGKPPNVPPASDTSKTEKAAGRADRAKPGRKP